VVLESGGSRMFEVSVDMILMLGGFYWFSLIHWMYSVVRNGMCK
jgi:hypothetical protein